MEMYCITVVLPVFFYIAFSLCLQGLQRKHPWTFLCTSTLMFPTIKLRLGRRPVDRWAVFISQPWPTFSLTPREKLIHTHIPFLLWINILQTNLLIFQVTSRMPSCGERGWERFTCQDGCCRIKQAQFPTLLWSGVQIRSTPDGPAH